MIMQHALDRSTERETLWEVDSGVHITQVALPGAVSIGQDATTTGRPIVKMVNNPLKPRETKALNPDFFMFSVNIS